MRAITAACYAFVALASPVMTVQAGDDKKTTNRLEWLPGQWWLCDERQTRLIDNAKGIFFTSTTQCSDVFGFKITALTDDNANFKLEHGGFKARCATFGIPADVECDADGKIEVNEVFVGAVSLNPKWQNEIAFVGTRLEYRDPDSGDFVPVTTFVDGYFTTLKVDATSRNQLFVDWVSTIRRSNAEEPLFDLMSVRSWKLVKDLSSCDTCPEELV